MTPFFAYLIKSSISLAVQYSLFRFVMRNDKNHTLNRFLLLGILFISAVIPFLNIQFFYEEVALQQVEVFREFVSPPVFADASPQEIIQPINEVSNFSINPWLAFYVLITVALLSRIVFGVIKVTQIIKRAEKRRLQKIILAVVKDLIQPFTFLNKVVISEKDFTENKDIIVAHEHAHIKLLHAIDLMVCEVFTVVHFFNPFMWWLRRDLKLIHEYQADQAVLNKGIDAKKYQLLVLQKSVGERRFAMANHFTQKPILKRLQMMQKKNRKQWAALKLILFLPLLVILLQAFARPEILIEKASEFVPMIAQQDSSEVWLNNWTIKNISNINGGLITKKVEVKPPPPNYPKSGLPKYDKSRDGHPIPSANIFPILINRNNDLLAANKRISQKEIERGVERFLTGNHPFEDSKTGPEFVDVNLPNIGKRNISKGVIIVQYDRDTDEKTIEDILRNIGRAHLNVREQRAKMEFGKEYFSLSAVQRSAIDQIVPIRVSVVSPKIVSPPPPPPPKVVEVLSIILKNDNKDIDYDNIRESAEKHLKTPNHSDYVIVSAEEGISEDDIEKVKKELLMAGIKSVKVVSNSDIK